MPFITDDIIQKAIRNGIKRNVRDMVKAPGRFIGVSGIKYTAKLIEKWRAYAKHQITD